MLLRQVGGAATPARACAQHHISAMHRLRAGLSIVLILYIGIPIIFLKPFIYLNPKPATTASKKEKNEDERGRNLLLADICSSLGHYGNGKQTHLYIQCTLSTITYLNVKYNTHEVPHAHP